VRFPLRHDLLGRDFGALKRNPIRLLPHLPETAGHRGQAFAFDVEVDRVGGQVVGHAKLGDGLGPEGFVAWTRFVLLFAHH
jgi:hypothetical protein